MIHIALEDAQPGTVLASDVVDGSGRLLLRSGQEVTAKALRVFRMWGVPALDIEGDAPEVAPESSGEPDIDPAVRQAARAETEELFRHTDRHHPLIAQLLSLAAARYARTLTKASTHDQ